MNKIVTKAPSNIALIKYWGKKDFQIPCNPSISFTLKNCYTESSIEYEKSSELKVELYFENVKNVKFEQKVFDYFKKVATLIPELNRYKFIIKTKNTFPHSAGIASSASSMASIAFFITEFIKRENLKIYLDISNLNLASYLARIGSGSAARSIHLGFNVWGRSELINSHDEFSISINDSIHPEFQTIQDSILIVDSKDKAVSSSLGHKQMENSSFASARYLEANKNFYEMIFNLKNGDWETFFDLCEKEALSIHAMMMLSQAPYILLKPNSLNIINLIRNYKNELGEVAYTIDAGPNIHLLYPLKNKKKIADFIVSELCPYLENGNYIDDLIGGSACLL